MSGTTNRSKKEKGQFFTPIGIAEFMSRQITVSKAAVSILDPGCGTAILSCCLIEKLAYCGTVKNIHLVCYETDLNLIPFTTHALTYLKEVLEKRNVSFEYSISNQDFILSNHQSLDDNSQPLPNESGKFDIIISNPPYFKLSKEDTRVKATRKIINGQPNIYSLFMAVSARMLKEDGKMIFIVPRSFTSGRYFQLFRHFFLKNIQIEFIHLFNTRKDTFAKDNVLQETLIIKAKTKAEQNDNSNITISFSEGIKDLESPGQKTFPQDELIDILSAEKIIHLPVTTREENIIRLFKSWNGSLNKYDIQISTGPVVAFRMENYLKEEVNGEVAPLFWLHNVIKMLADHPVSYKGKKQYIEITPVTKSVLIPNRNYVFLRRFSAKDDKSRLIAAPYLCNASDTYYIGVENKLNYIYRPKGHLDRTEVIGISALLNSELCDTYFRTFNGNVNVSATELRSMPMPSLETIKAIGERLILKNNFSIDNVNEIINDFFEMNN